MTWFWLNMPLAAVFFAAWVAIPMWLVFKHQGTASLPRHARQAVPVQAVPVELPAEPVLDGSEHPVGV